MYQHIKPIRDYVGNEPCPECDSVGERVICPAVQFIGTKIQDPYFNQGLNSVVKSKKDKNELAKRLNVEEVGNDYKSGAAHDQDYDKKLQEKLSKRWDDI